MSVTPGRARSGSADQWTAVPPPETMGTRASPRVRDPGLRPPGRAARARHTRLRSAAIRLHPGGAGLPGAHGFRPRAAHPGARRRAVRRRPPAPPAARPSSWTSTRCGVRSVGTAPRRRRSASPLATGAAPVSSSCTTRRRCDRRRRVPCSVPWRSAPGERPSTESGRPAPAQARGGVAPTGLPAPRAGRRGGAGRTPACRPGRRSAGPAGSCATSRRGPPSSSPWRDRSGLSPPRRAGRGRRCRGSTPRRCRAGRAGPRRSTASAPTGASSPCCCRRTRRRPRAPSRPAGGEASRRPGRRTPTPPRSAGGRWPLLPRELEAELLRLSPETDVTGRSSPSCVLRFCGIRASHCCCVTSVAAIRKARVRVTRRGASSSCRRGSPGGLPMRKRPGATRTIRIPREFVTTSAGDTAAWP